MAISKIVSARVRNLHRLIPFPGTIDDGSTLSLDFTTGVLDPRLTFTRGSNATFTNSSGYVEWAAANTLVNSVFAGASGTTAPTGWTPSFVGGTGLFTLNGTNLTISNNNSATRSRIYQTGPTGNGLYVTVQLKVVAKGGTPFALVELLSYAINGASAVTYKVNGVVQSSAYTGWGAGDTVTLTCIPTVGSAATCLFGIGASGAQATDCSVTITDIQIEPGMTARTYIPTTTSGAYYAPRFDYDPTSVGTLKGLLIEGSTTNYVLNSATLTSGSGWVSNPPMTVATATATTPDGLNVNTVCQLSCVGSGSFRSSGIAVTAGLKYTFSFWAKNNGGSVALYRAFNVTAGADIVPETSYYSQINSSTWTRIQFTFTVPTGCSSVYVYPLSQSSGTSNLLVWGAQLEQNSGASSYIPTGSSTATRSGDFLTSTSSAGVSRTTEFSLDDLAAGTSSLSALTVYLEYQRYGMSNAYPASLYVRNDSNTGRLDFRDFSGTTVEIKTGSTSVQSQTNIGAFSVVKDAIAADGVVSPPSAINGISGSQTAAVQSIVGSKWTQLGGTVSAVAGSYNTIALRKLKLWPYSLTSATLQSLTS